MRVTAFAGSARKGFTHQAVERLLACLRELGEVECEIVVLSDYRLERCVGCKLCFDKGEQCCPLKDG